MAQYLPPLGPGSPRTVVDLIDVDSQKWLDYAAASRGLKRALYGLEARRVRRLEKSLPARCDLLAVVSEEEAACFRGFDAAAPLEAIPNGVDYEYFHPNDAVAERPYSCAFVGALDYKPNVEAAHWFCENVWPEILARIPSAMFSVVGRRPSAVVRRLAERPGVRLLADVPDVRPALWEASVVVAPLQIARGVQNKVLEAMAVGKTVIASPGAVTGLAAKVGDDLLVADAASAWIDAVWTALTNPELTLRIGRAARQFIVSNCNWSNSLDKLNWTLGADSLPTRRR